LKRIQEEAMKKSKAYQPDLIESLRDAGEAEEYLNAALEEGDPELFLLALRNVAEVQGGVAQLADKAKLNRESLYKILSARSNPELKSLDALLHALGFQLAVTANR
jgi:probable addiction module antidote protein